MSLANRFKSFGYAFKGLAVLFREEVHAQFHLFATFVVTFAGWYFQISKTEWCLVILTIALVIATEALNTAIENLTDLTSPEIHPLAGKAKDLAAAGVLIAAFGAAAVGSLIFLPKVIAHF